MKGGAEGFALFQKPVGQFLPGHHRQARNVIDRLFRIKLGALAARPVQNVDQMGFQVQKPKLEHGKQADGPGTDDGDVCLNRSGHASFHNFFVCDHKNLWSIYVKRCAATIGIRAMRGASYLSGRCSLPYAGPASQALCAP